MPPQLEKPWKYTLIPHDTIAENMTLAGLATQLNDSSHSP